MQIFLADLGHNQVTLSSDVYPLGIANLASYLAAHGSFREPVTARIFRDPQDLKAALENGSPDILALSSYAWNHELSLQFAAWAKRRSPELLTLMGGPNWPLTRDEQESYLRTLGPIDVFVQGPTYEGERAFLGVVERFSAAGKRRQGLYEEPVPGGCWIDPESGDFVHRGGVERIKDLDEIPSPYQAGLLDSFFATGLFPMMQISRGCPFTCTFCNSAVAGNSKITRHSVDEVMRDLRYIAERVKPEIPLCLADDNFGMYPWDEEVADRLPALQQEFGWPKYIRTTTGKNHHERIIRVMRKSGGILPMTAAVQSTNPEVMRNIKRDNIKLEAYREIQKEVQAQGMQSYGELILCLPGESRESFMQAVDDLLDAGVKRVSAHQLMLLHGAPLSNPDERERWSFQTVYRVVARNIGHYLEEPAIEVEEIVVETPTFSFDDYLDSRVFHLLLTIFHYEGNFDEAFAFARQHGVRPFQVVVRMQELLDQAPAGLRAVVDDFVRESKEELFETKEACVEWAKENFEGLVDGSLGGNLLSKYSILGRFFVTADALAHLDRTLASLELGDDEARRAVIDYLEAVLLSSPFADSLDAEPEWRTAYDVEAWRDGGYEEPLGDFRLDRPRTFRTAVEPQRRQQLQVRLATFGEHPSGIGKFTRTMFATDLRRRVDADSAGGRRRRMLVTPTGPLEV